jgi:hypothetical protein
MSDLSAGESSPKKTELTGEALLLAIRKQVEFYFSPSNLSMDKFLVSQMDPQMFVPLQVIANFKKVQMLTKVRTMTSGSNFFLLASFIRRFFSISWELIFFSGRCANRCVSQREHRGHS